ncbi:MerR family transcriptional regulator [Nonomuraea typhae]|uniref:MerR family transcriptional regulator n=1 Tax=Nonomuraea typhae TaxID=2603600 RepID=UPI001CA57A16|nr:MerR family transcriptional regulator [Nonomuraea typhae]
MAGDRALVPIREVADGFAIPISTLHYWERQGLLTPDRRGGQRRYDAGQLRRIALIQLWRETGMLSIADITAILTGRDAGGWRDTVSGRIEAIGEQIERLDAARTYLSHLLTCTHEPLEACPTFRAMADARARSFPASRRP